MKNYLDSNVLAYAFYINPHQEACQQAIEAGGIISTLTLMEAFHAIERESNREIAQDCIRKLLRGNFQIVEIDANIFFQALKRTAHTKLNMADAIHYTCALLNHCSAILIFNKDFNNLDIPRKEP
ncbi:MAG: PIN domain-containing protein [Nanoarchaeota archaeon]